MSEFNITPEKVELENGDIEIVRLNNNLIFRDNAQGITLTIDQDTELSQLWNAFDSQIDTSQFFQENASGLAELLSGYAGLDLAGEDIENANVVNASTGEFGSVSTDDLSTTNAPTFDGVESDIHWEQIAVLDPSDGAPLEASVEPFEVVRLIYSLRLGAAGDIFLRVNGDGASTGSYGYYDQSGAKNTGQNEFLILSGSDNFAGSTGVVEIRDDGNGRIGFSNTAQLSLFNDVDAFGITGGRNITSDPVTDISINTNASFSSVGGVRVFGGVNQ